jgi:hypothetical protein
LKAWLVTWEWMNDDAAMNDKVAAILDPRLGEAKVAFLVEQLYALATSTAAELARYAGRRGNNPYQATNQSGRIVCGHHPWLEARVVQAVEVVTNQQGIETISWKEPDRYELRDGKPTKVAEGVKQLVSRNGQGPLRWGPLRTQFS